MSVETQAKTPVLNTPALETPVQETPVLEWCLPVIHDCLTEFYHGQALAGQGRPDLLIESHFTLWSALAYNVFDHLPDDHERLVAEARSLRVDERTCRAADLYVAAEIFEMIQRRFRCVNHEAHANHSALLALLRRLQRQENLEATLAVEAKPSAAPQTKPAPLRWAA
jgi:hypothetical protein